MESRKKTHTQLMRHLGIIFKILIATALLFFLIHSAQIKFELFSGILDKPLSFSAAICMFLLMVVLSAQRWHLINAAQNINIGFIRTITPTYLGVAFNNLLPGAIGGDLVRSYYLFKKAPQKKSAALISIFLDRMFGFLSLILVCSAVVITHLSQLHAQPHLFYLLFIFAFFCLSILVVFAILMILPQRFTIDGRLYKRISSKRWAKSVISLIEAMRIYRTPKMVMMNCLLISIIIQLIAAVTIMIIANMMYLPPIAFSDYIIALSVTQVVNLVPATPGGIGIGEMAFAKILLLLNPGTAVPYATVFLAYRLISMLTYLPGVICYIPHFMLLREKKDL